MQNFNSKIKNLFEKIKTKKIVYIKDCISPIKDWNAFASFSLYAFILAIIVSVYFYNQIELGKLFYKKDDTVSSKSTRINQTLLNKNMDEINKKQFNRDNLDKDIPKDPSI